MDVSENIRPEGMAAAIRSQTRDRFVRTLDTALLLVRLDEPHSDLAKELDGASRSGGSRLEPTIRFETVVGTLSSSGAALMTHAARVPFAGTTLRQKLREHVYFAVPLHKREGASNIFSGRISVGRSRTNDVVLRAPSVSKFHAWFECDDNDVFYLNDAKSKNATLVNRVQLEKSASAALTAGDEIRFGEVSTIFCSAEILWDAVRS